MEITWVATRGKRAISVAVAANNDGTLDDIRESHKYDKLEVRGNESKVDVYMDREENSKHPA